MKKIFAAIMTLAALVSCTSNQKSKTLVLYYSQTGATKTVAEAIANKLGADIEAFDVVEPYDGTYEETIQRCQDEMSSGVALAALKELKSDVSKYETIFIGYPVWFGTCARPVMSLSKKVSLEGKTVVPFCTFGSGGLEASTKALQALFPKANVQNGFGIRNARIANVDREVKQFLAENAFTDDIREVMHEFSEMEALSDQTLEIFNQACGSYPMPIGTPLSVCSRSRVGGTEYLYNVESQDANGNPALAQVYVLAQNGIAPEFTRVVR